MSFYLTCQNCGKPECMDPDNGVHFLDDGRICQDPRDAEIESLRAELHRITQEPDVRSGDLISRAAVTALIEESAAISDDEARVGHIANGVLMLPSAAAIEAKESNV